MTVQFNNALVCDVITTEYQGQEYFKAMVYSYDDNELYAVGLKKDEVEVFNALIGEKTSFSAKLRSYDGKNKFTYQK